MLSPLFSKVYYKGGVSLKQVAYGMTYGDYAWTVKKPYILKGSASKTTYTTKKKALTVSLRKQWSQETDLWVGSSLFC